MGKSMSKEHINIMFWDIDETECDRCDKQKSPTAHLDIFPGICNMVIILCKDCLREILDGAPEKKYKCKICKRDSYDEICDDCDMATSQMAGEVMKEEDKRVIKELNERASDG